MGRKKAAVVEKKSKPKVFVGSSKEGLKYAHAIQANLDSDMDVTVWDQGVFELSLVNLEALMQAVEIHRFGVFVFSPDDVAKIRIKKYKVVRDNVVFEFGLFIGRHGRNSVYFVVPKGTKEFHIPSDLLGVTPATYDPERVDNLTSALGTACTQIREAVMKVHSAERSAAGAEQKPPPSAITVPPLTRDTATPGEVRT